MGARVQKLEVEQKVERPGGQLRQIVSKQIAAFEHKGQTKTHLSLYVCERERDESGRTFSPARWRIRTDSTESPPERCCGGFCGHPERRKKGKSKAIGVSDQILRAAVGHFLSLYGKKSNVTYTLRSAVRGSKIPKGSADSSLLLRSLQIERPHGYSSDGCTHTLLSHTHSFSQEREREREREEKEGWRPLTGFPG